MLWGILNVAPLSWKVLTFEFPLENSETLFISCQSILSEIVPAPRVTLRPVWFVLTVRHREGKLSHFDLILFVNIINCHKYLSFLMFVCLLRICLVYCAFVTWVCVFLLFLRLVMWLLTCPINKKKPI